MSDDTRYTLDAGSRRVQVTVVVATLAVAASAFAAGFPALIWAGQLASLGAFAYVVPLVLDAGLTVSGLAAAVRHAQRRSARLESTLMVALTLLSAAVQVAHSWSSAPGEVIPALVVGALPIALLLSTHSALRAVTAEPARRGARRTAQSATRVAEPAARSTAEVAERPAAQPRKRPAQPRPTATHTLDEAVAEVRAGQLSIRSAATAAGVSRYAISQAI